MAGTTSIEVDRRSADRRDLRFADLDDILADARTMRGDDSVTGNWSPAQIVQHVARVVTASLDGVDIRAALPLRIMGRMMKGGAMRKPLKPGINLSAKFSAFIPDPDARWEDALAELEREIARVKAGTPMNKPSPVFGPMTPEDWTRLHCRHAEMHFGFVRSDQREAT